MFKKISKLMISIAILLGIGAIFMSPVSLTANAVTLKEQQFEVTKYLDLGKDVKGKDQQAQSYFKDTKTSPTVAFLVKAIQLAVKIAGTLAVVLMIGTGLTLVMSQGNQNLLEKAKQMFVYELIGLVVIFTSYVLVTFVQSIFTTT